MINKSSNLRNTLNEFDFLPGKKIKFSMGWFATYMFMIILVGFTSLPIVYMVVTAFKPINELFLFPPRFFVRNPTFQNFTDLITTLDSQVVPFTRYIFNSVFTTVLSVFGTVLVCSMGAFAVDKCQLPGGNTIFKIVIMALMFSPPAAQIPIYMAVSSMGMLNTYWVLIIPKLATPIYFFLMKQFISQIPDSIIESANIDGAGVYRTYWQIAMPMAKAAAATVVVFSFIANWNDAFAPLVYISNQAMKTMPFALSTIASGGIARAGAASAATMLTTVPTILIYLLMQARVLKTMAHSGIKG